MRFVLRVLAAALLSVVALVMSSTSASAATEGKISWSYEEAQDVNASLDRTDVVCDVGSLAFQGPFSVLGLACGRGFGPLRAAVNEAVVKKCGIDLYITPGYRSYDTRTRYVVCP